MLIVAWALPHKDISHRVPTDNLDLVATLQLCWTWLQVYLGCHLLRDLFCQVHIPIALHLSIHVFPHSVSDKNMEAFTLIGNVSELSDQEVSLSSLSDTSLDNLWQHTLPKQQPATSSEQSTNVLWVPNIYKRTVQRSIINTIRLYRTADIALPDASQNTCIWNSSRTWSKTSAFQHFGTWVFSIDDSSCSSCQCL